MQNQNYTKNYTKGITLIECVVGVTILAFAIAGPMTLASQSLRAARDARSELIATHLAEEGIEVLHNIRDNNSADDLTLMRVNWMTGITTNCTSAEGCIVDITAHPAAITPCSGVGCAAVNMVYYNPATGVYRQSGAALSSPWQPTIYRRMILVTPIDDPTTPQRQVRVVSTVTYVSYNNKIRSVSVGDDFYNWFPALH